MNPDELFRRAKELFPSCQAKRVSGPSWYITCCEPFFFDLFAGFEGRDPELTLDMTNVAVEDLPLLAKLIKGTKGKTTLGLKLDVNGGWVVADLICGAKPTFLCYIASPNPEAAFHRVALISSPIAPHIKEQMDAALDAEPDEAFRSVASEAYAAFFNCVKYLEEVNALKVVDGRSEDVLALIERLKADYPNGSLKVDSDYWRFTSTEPFRFAVYWEDDPDFTDLLSLDVDLTTVDDTELHLIPELIEKVNPDGVRFTAKFCEGERFAVGEVNLMLNPHVLLLTTNTRPRAASFTDEDSVMELLRMNVMVLLSEEGDSALKEIAADFYGRLIKQVDYLEQTGILKRFT